MQRVAIIGCSGAGKSTLARQVGAMLDIDVLHLDRLHWKPGWVETPREQFASLQRDLVRQPRWVMDGNYGGTMDIRLDAADTIIFLDLPRRTCLLRVVRRVVTHRGRVRPDMGDGCPEHWPGRAFLRWIWRFRRDHRPGILRQLERLAGADGSKTIIRLRSRGDVARFLARLESVHGGAVAAAE